MFAHWLRKLLPAAAPARRKPTRPAARPDLVQLEDRSTPANVTFNGAEVLFDIDTANEQITTQFTGASTVKFTTTAAFTGDIGGTFHTFIGFSKFTFTDSAAGAKISYLDGGANAANAEFSVNLDDGSAGLTFAGTQTFGAFPQLFVADAAVSLTGGAALSTTNNPVTLTGTLVALNGSVTAPGSTVSLTATAQSIVDQNGVADNVTAANLVASAKTGVGSGNALETAVTNLEAAGGTGDVGVSNIGDLTIGGIGAVVGVQSTGGAVTVATSGNLTVTEAVSAGGVGAAALAADFDANGVGDLTNTAAGTVSTAGGAIDLSGADIDLAGTVSATANGIVTVAPTKAAVAIDLGTDGAGFGFTDADVDLVTAKVLRVGETNGGAITVSAAVSASGAKVGTLSLLSGSTIADAAAGSIAAQNLRLTAGTGAALDSAANNVNALAGEVTGAGNFTYADSNGVGVGTADGVVGVTAANGNVAVTTDTGNITLFDLVSAETAGNTVTLVAVAGAVTDGNAGANNVTATNLALVASTGIGAAGNPVETTVSNLEARTTTGGLYVSNTGALSVGNVNAGLGGVEVTGASGDIELTNAGSISLLTFEEIVFGPDAVTVTATGATANVLAASNNGIAIPGAPRLASVVSTGGPVVVTAGQDVLAGNGAQVGNIFGGGSVNLTAGRDVIVNTNSYLEARGAGTFTIDAGRDITINSTGLAGSHIRTAGGAIALTTGAGGTLTVAAAGAETLDVDNGNGPITLTADRMVLVDTITAGIGTVTLRAVTAGQKIDLGSAVDTTANTLELSDAELDLITAGTVVVGSAANTGGVTVSAAISPAAAANLTVLTDGTVSVNDGVSVTGAFVAQAGTSFTLAASKSITVGAGNALTIEVDTIGTVDAAGGTATINGDLVASAGATLAGGAENDSFTVNMATLPLSSDLAVSGNGGNDALTVKLGAGVNLANDVTFDGGAAGSDKLRVFGGATQTAAVNLTPVVGDPGNGTVTVGAGQVIFNNLEPVDLVNLLTVDVTFEKAGIQADVLFGKDFLAGTKDAIRIVPSAGGPAFESLAVWNTKNLNIDTTAVAGTDAITLFDSNGTTHNVTNFSIKTGNETGDAIATANAAQSFSVTGTFAATTGGTIKVGTNFAVNGGAGVSLSTTPDDANATQSITLGTGASVVSSGGDVLISSADELVATGAALISAAAAGKTVTLAIDAGNKGGAEARLVGVDIVAAAGATLTGNGGDDEFYLSKYTAALAVDGKAGSDKVCLDGQNKYQVVLNGYASATVGGGGLISFTSIEEFCFENTTDLKACGDATNDAFVVETNDGTPYYTFNGGAKIFLPVDGKGNTTLDVFTICGGDGSDTATVRFTTTGDSFDQIADAIVYDGEGKAGVDSDSLAVVGAGDNRVRVGLTPTLADSGRGSVDDGSAVLTFVGLEPVDVSNMAQVWLTFAGAGDEVTVAAGKLFANPAAGALVVSGFTGGLAFEKVALRGVAAVYLDTTTVAGTDAVTFNASGPVADHLIASFTTNTGTEANDKVTVAGDVAVGGDFTVSGFDLAGNVATATVGTRTLAVNAKVNAARDVYAQTANGITSTAAVTAGRDATYKAAGAVSNTSTVTANRDLLFTAGTTINSATATATTGTLTMTAAGAVTSGTATGAGAVALTSTGGDVKTTVNTASANAAVTLTAKNSVTNSGTASAKTSVTFTATNGTVTNSGAVTATTGTVAFTAGNKIANNAGGVLKAGADVTLTATNELTNAAGVTAARNVTFTSTANSVTNGGAVTATAGDVFFSAKTDVTNTGTLKAGQDVKFLAKALVLNNNVGTITATRDVIFQATTDVTNQGLGGKVSAGRDLVFTAGGMVTNNAAVTAVRNAVFTAATTVTNTAAVAAGGDVTFTATTGAVLNSGAVTAGGSSRFTAGTAVVNSAAVTAGQVVDMTTTFPATGITNTATLKAGTGISLYAAGGSVKTAGVALTTTNGDINIRAGQNIDAQGAKFTAANGTLRVQLDQPSPSFPNTISNNPVADFRGATIAAKSASISGGKAVNHTVRVDAGYATQLAVTLGTGAGTDTLEVTGAKVDLTGRSVRTTGDAAKQFVTYANVEQVVLVNATDVVVLGDAPPPGAKLDDVVKLSKAAATYAINVNGQAVSAPTLARFAFNGLLGDDCLILDPSLLGTPVFANGVGFDGGAGSDAASVTGTGTQSAVFTPAATDYAGKLAVGANALNLLGTEGLDLASFAKVTVTPVAATNVLALAPGQSVCVPVNSLILSGTSGGAAVTMVAVSKSGEFAVDLSGTAGNDSLAVNAGNNGHGVGKLTFDAGPGTDTLTYDAVNQAVTATANSFTAAGVTLTYANVETVALANATKAVTVNGGAGGDVLTVSKSGAAFVYQFTGSPRVTLPQFPASFAFNGLAGKDQLNVLYAGGDPVPAGGVAFDGGADADVGLLVVGTGAEAAVVTADPAGAGLAGTVTVNTGTIRFSNLDAASQVDVTKVASVTVGFGTADDKADINTGFDVTAGGAKPALVISPVAGGPAFAKVGVWNATTLTLTTTGTDGNDSITVTRADNAHNVTNLAIDTGTGADGVTVNGPTVLAGTLAVRSKDIAVRQTTITAGGNVTFTTGGTLTFDGATVSTGGAFLQDGPGAVALTGGNAVTSTAKGAVQFNGTVDGPGGLTANTGGTTAFLAAVGANVPLADLTTDAGGTTRFDGGTVRTAGAQTYGDDVAFTRNTTFATTAGGNLTFAAAVNASAAGLDLTLSAPGADVSLAKDLGTPRLGLLTIADAQNVTFAGAVAAGALVQAAGTGATKFQGPVDLTFNADVTTKTVTTAAFTAGTDAIFRVPGDLTFGGPLAAKTLTQVGGTGATTFNGPVTVGADASITAGSVTAADSFRAGAGGGSGLVTLAVPGAVTFAGPLTAGAFVQTGGTKATTFNGEVNLDYQADITAGSVTANAAFTAGAKGFGPVRLDVPGDVTFNGLLTAGFLQQLNGAGTTTFNKEVVILGGNPSADVKAVDLATKNLITAAAFSAVNGDVRLNVPGDVTFNGSLTARSLTQINGAGTTTLNKDVTVTGDGTAVDLNTKNLTTAGKLTAVNGDVRLNLSGDATIGGPLTTRNLFQVSGAKTTFNGPVELSAAANLTAGRVAFNNTFDAKSGTVTLALSDGATEGAGGAVRTTVLALTGAGTFQLDATGNDVTAPTGGLFANLTSGGVLFRDANDLTLRLRPDATSALVIGGSKAVLDLTAAGVFDAQDTSTDNRFDVPLIDLGEPAAGGVARVFPGVGVAAGAANPVTFLAEVRAAGLSLGTTSGDPLSNTGKDTFTVRPSATTPITVNGNDPTRATLNGQTGDTLVPVFTGFDNAGQVLSRTGDDGNYTSQNGKFQPLNFTSIETLGGLSLDAFVVQTAPRDGGEGAKQFAIRLAPTQTSVDPGGNAQPVSVNLTGSITGSGSTSNPFIVSPQGANNTQPFGSPRLSLGDVNGDGFTDLIIANGPDDLGLITVLDGQQLIDNPKQIDLNNINPGQILAQFYPYEPSFNRGIVVAAADLDGDGKAELITGPLVGGGQRVRVFSILNPVLLNNGLAARGLPQTASVFSNAYQYDGRELGYAVDAAGVPQPVAGGKEYRLLQRPGGGNFFAFNEAGTPDEFFRGGVNVAAGDVDGDGVIDLVVGAGVGGGPRVQVYSGASADVNAPVRNFFAYDPSFRGGVFVDAGNFDGDTVADVLTAPGSGGGPHVRVFAGAAGDGLVPSKLLADFFAFTPGGALVSSEATSQNGVGGIAFGSSIDGTQSNRAILVVTPRGTAAQVLRFDPTLFNTDGSFKGTPGDLLRLKNLAGVEVFADPTSPQFIGIDPDLLRDGGAVAGFGGNPNGATTGPSS